MSHPADPVRPGQQAMSPASEKSPAWSEVVEQMLSRRQALQSFVALAAAGAWTGTAQAQEPNAGTPAPANAAGQPNNAGGQATSTLTFAEVPAGLDEQMHVAAGYEAQVVIRWGDPLFPVAPAFDPAQQSAAAQSRQFGYNCDFVAYLPLPQGSTNSTHGLLCVNHEYTNPELMFPGLTRATKVERMTAAQVDIELAAHGHSVVEIELVDGRWQVKAGSPFARRLTATLEMALSGPVAGHERVRTNADPTGLRVYGTLNNCAGGVSPWGTVLLGEENFDQYFGGRADHMPEPMRSRELANHRRFGVGFGTPDYAWSKFHPRFHVEQEPREANRFGWIVEFDPFDPLSKPIKRTALGRMKHEGAATTVSASGQVVLYTGDDEMHQYLYKFVTARPFNADHRAANRDLFDDGTLYVARFSADQTLRWLPLRFGHGPLTEANGFQSQADVLIDTRQAAELVGATALDRPEDVEANPATGRVYVMLTNNVRRTEADAVNPRVNNKHGQIVELVPPLREGRADHAAEVFQWSLFLLGGNPAPTVTENERGRYAPGTSADGWLSCPDNCAFDQQGRIWIATDGAPKATTPARADGIFASDTQGPGRALTRQFFRAPIGAEICGPAFTPDNQTLFASIQHPAESSTFDAPSTRWPDFNPALPPRPSVVAIRKCGPGPIGS